ncbi:TIGR03668 family PPOX class F420-dependent oxidoreductase [Frankia canadensis]
MSTRRPGPWGTSPWTGGRSGDAEDDREVAWVEAGGRGTGATVRLSTREARERFAAGRVARLATSGPGGQPLVVPVTFAVTDLAAAGAPPGGRGAPAEAVVSIVDHKPKSTSTGLRRLRDIAANPRVSLLVDHYEDDWERLWWARVDGLARIVLADEAEHAATRAALAARYAQYRQVPPGGPAIIVTGLRWSGWAYADAGAGG